MTFWIYFVWQQAVSWYNKFKIFMKSYVFTFFVSNCFGTNSIVYLQGPCCLRPCSSRPCCNYVWLQKDFDPHCVQKACLLTWKILAIRQKRTAEDKDRKKQPGKDFTNRLFFLQKVGFSSVDILFVLSFTTPQTFSV